MSGWFTLDGPLDYLAMVGIFVLTGLAMWLVMFVVFAVILPKRRISRGRPPRSTD